MAAGTITVDHRPATIESESTKNEVIINASRVMVTNVGDKDVFISMNKPAGNLQRDGLQILGEIQLEPGDSIPLPASTPKFEHQCLAAQTTRLWVIPNVG